MDGHQMPEKEPKVNWAVEPGSQQSKYFTVLINGLNEAVEWDTLWDAFIPFGKISKCKVVVDPATHKPRGYGFVSFTKKMEAENAILSMNGEFLCGRPIIATWAVTNEFYSDAEALSYEQVFNQTSDTNCTVYCGGLKMELTEDMIWKLFSPYGVILDVRLFTAKGYAFIDFSSKESATNAIVSVHSTEINGQRMRCSWSNEACLLNQSMTADGLAGTAPNSSQLSYEEVFSQTSDTNCTVYCGGTELTHDMIWKTFTPYGVISNVRLYAAKGYAFIDFSSKESATNAIVFVHNTEIDGQRLRCSWSREASLSNQPTAGDGPVGTAPNASQLSYEEVFSKASPTNCTVFCTGVKLMLTEELIRESFSPYGTIDYIRVLSEKGYAFVKFFCKESATNAIVSVNNSEVNGQRLKCTWAKDSNELNHSMAADDQAGFVPNAGQLSYEEVLNQRSPTNCTVFCRGMTNECALVKTFSPYGVIRSMRVIGDKGFAFIKFCDKASATNAIVSVHNTEVDGQQLSCAWADKDIIEADEVTAAGSSPGPSTYEEVFNQTSPTNCTIFCKGVMKGLTQELLKNVFSEYGVIRDMRVFLEKGYAFVKFCDKESATNAIVSMKTTKVNGRLLKCIWAWESSDPNQTNAAGDPAGSLPNPGQRSYVFNQTFPNNCSVYFSGVTDGLTEDLIRKTFSPYGVIRDMRIFESKGHAFVKFDSKESATNAIVSVNRTMVNGHMVKCSWGKYS